MNYNIKNLKLPDKVNCCKSCGNKLKEKNEKYNKITTELPISSSIDIRYIDTIGPILAEIYSLLQKLVDLSEETLRKKSRKLNTADDFDDDF